MPNFVVEDLSDYTTYSNLTSKGFTIYRKSGGHHLFIVPPGASHSDAWRAINGEWP